MARSFEPGTERDRRIKQACRERGCTLTSLVNDAIDLYLDAEVHEELDPEQGNSIPGRRGSNFEPYDVHNQTTGCISRYRANGELMFHFKPVEKKDGRQYYRDTLGSNSDRKWYQHSDGSWIQVAIVR